MSKFLSEERKDAVKLLFDAFKHLTTLCTGSIVLLATFLRDIPDTGWSKLFAVGAIIFLLIAVLLSVVVLILIPKVLAEDGLRDERVKSPFMVAAVFGGGSFILGIIMLAVFVVINLGSF
ncbi:hypothetical protein L0668_18670 [Paraglaciecola aquimarina]|uniref:DUF202 domain-containing protein n=1 Tax=Paraglaciecola algarum TaxID=3050085 RepID=A0ABS9DB12_9ALTE|nr:hypothetical protein [Paraglaciecola sp. G1-23]MCF2950142.1 hypothetical protein [Paraglaciecola sp. G1-23]